MLDLRRQLGVKTGKPRSEQILTAVPSIADMKLVHVRPNLRIRRRCSYRRWLAPNNSGKNISNAPSIKNVILKSTNADKIEVQVPALVFGATYRHCQPDIGILGAPDKTTVAVHPHLQSKQFNQRRPYPTRRCAKIRR